MTAIEVIEKVVNTELANADLKYCLVNTTKQPFRFDGNIARPNTVEDFVDINTLLTSTVLDDFAGIGISVQASNVCAIDVDRCFNVANDINSADDRAKHILEMFKDKAYCEFSFSGTGLRIIFKTKTIDNYSDKYYIKNEKYKVEYYQPTKSFRYVTLTGNTIANNKVEYDESLFETVENFLNEYMKRKVIAREVLEEVEETRSYEELMKRVKYLYLKDTIFQDLWFTNAPGSGKDESERDYHLVAYLYENVTQDKDLIKQIFETSHFFKTKDSHHMYKWTNQNFRYFNYLYDRIRRTK